MPQSGPGFVLHYSGVLVPDGAAIAATDADYSVFDAFVWQPVSQCIYEAPAVALTKEALIRAYATVQARLGPGTVGKVSPLLQLRYSQSESQDPAMWTADGNPFWAADASTLMWAGLSPWLPWTKGILQTMAVQMRVVMNTSDGLSILQQFTPTVDQPDLSDGGMNVTVAAGGTRVEFANPNFLEPPFIGSPSVVAVNGGGGGYASAVDVDADGFTAHVFDSTGADAGGVINWSCHN